MVLDRFSFLSVPAAEADRVIEALDGREVRGQALSLERVAGQLRVSPAADGRYRGRSTRA